jgi:hypothetical protein
MTVFKYVKMNVKSFAVSFSNVIIILLLNEVVKPLKIPMLFSSHISPVLSWRMHFCDRLRARYYRGRAALSSGRTAFSGENNPLRPVRISTRLLRPLVVR